MAIVLCNNAFDHHKKKMEKPIFITHILQFVVLVSLMSGGVTAASEIPPVKAAYWPYDAVNFPPSSINTAFFTHIYYAFLMPNKVTYKFDTVQPIALSLSDFTTVLRHKTPPLKTLVSIGGGASDPTVFASMASRSLTRASFISSSIELARKFGFDGLDLDWEFPKTRTDMKNLGYLFDEWRLAIATEAKATCRSPLLLTAAVYFAVNFFLAEGRKYPVASIAKNLDWVNAMCFDYHGSWDTSITGAPAALFDPNSNITTSYGLQSWVKAGVPPKKVVMGFPLYGRTWQLQDPNSNWIGAPAVGVGPGDDGAMTFVEIEEFKKQKGATVVHDLATVSVYSFSGTAWIGYDDAITATIKVGYAQALGLRGYFFWAVNGDSEWKISKQASRAWIEE